MYPILLMVLLPLTLETHLCVEMMVSFKVDCSPTPLLYTALNYPALHLSSSQILQLSVFSALKLFNSPHGLLFSIDSITASLQLFCQLIPGISRAPVVSQGFPVCCGYEVFHFRSSSSSFLSLEIFEVFLETSV